MWNTVCLGDFMLISVLGIMLIPLYFVNREQKNSSDRIPLKVSSLIIQPMLSESDFFLNFQVILNWVDS